jgi:hypothetical protein
MGRPTVASTEIDSRFDDAVDQVPLGQAFDPLGDRGPTDQDVRGLPDAVPVRDLHLGVLGVQSDLPTYLPSSGDGGVIIR